MNTLVQPDPGLYIWTIVTFLVLVAALAKFAWRPLLEALERRQDQIRKSLDDAQKAKQELEKLNVESQRILAAATNRGRTDPVEYTLGRESLSRGVEAEGAGRSCRHREERREADRARNRARASADPNGSRRHLSGDCLQAARSQRVEGRQRAPHRRDVQADRRTSSQLIHHRYIPTPTSKQPGVWELALGNLTAAAAEQG